MKLKKPTFERWLTHVFDHSPTAPPWHESPDSEYWPDEDELKAEYIAETFVNASVHLARFDDRRAALGLRFVHGLGSEYLLGALSPAVPLEARVRVVKSGVGLFRTFFAVRRGEDCYEFDDIRARFWKDFPIDHAAREGDAGRLADALFAAMEEVLTIDDEECQRSVLRALAEDWHRRPDRVEQVVDRYLAANPAPDFPLRERALDARRGK